MRNGENVIGESTDERVRDLLRPRSLAALCHWEGRSGGERRPPETKRRADAHGIRREEFDAALNRFWLERAERVRTTGDWDRHVAEEEGCTAQTGQDAP